MTEPPDSDRRHGARPPAGTSPDRSPRRLLPDLAGMALSGLMLSGILEVVLPRALGPIWLGAALDAGILAVAGGSLALALWATDRVSLGHAALVGIGAYVAAAVTTYGHFLAFGTLRVQGGLFGPSAGLFLGALAAGTLAAAVAAAAIALPAVRAHAAVLPAVTLAFGEAVRRAWAATPDVLTDATTVRTASLPMLATSLGGEGGFTGAPFLTSPLWVGTALALLWIAAFVWKERGAPASLRGRVGALALAGAFAGLAGGLLAHAVGTDHRPDAFGLGASLELLAIAVIAGWGSMSGAALAAIAAVALREVPGTAELRPWLYGGVVVLVLAVRWRGWALPAWEVWAIRASRTEWLRRSR